MKYEKKVRESDSTIRVKGGWMIKIRIIKEKKEYNMDNSSELTQKQKNKNQLI